MMNVFSGSDEELKRMLAEFKEKLQEREIKLAEVCGCGTYDCLNL